MAKGLFQVDGALFFQQALLIFDICGMFAMSKCDVIWENPSHVAKSETAK